MSNDTFAIGEIAIYVGDYEEWKGLQVTISSELIEVNDAVDLTTGETFNGAGYIIDVPIPHNWSEVFAEPHELRKLPPDDGRKVVSWDDKLWRPKAIKEIT